MLAQLGARLRNRPALTASSAGRGQAAVAVVISARPEAILLIRRAERDGDVWSGHLAFPGGRAEPGDVDLSFTARRETREEVGLGLDEALLLGQLDDVAPNSPVLPPVLVRPFVFGIPQPAPLVLGPEVSRAGWVPLPELIDPAVFRPTEHHRYGTLVRFPGYHLEMGVVWGLTERVLTPLLDLIRQR